MASFSTPLDGLEATVEMQNRIREFDSDLPGQGGTIGLKAGLHRGPVIAVKANQTLDYFGQTVNIAARVQSLAAAGEIWFTSDFMKDPAASAWLKEKRAVPESRTAELKGVGTPVEVWQYRI